MSQRDVTFARHMLDATQKALVYTNGRSKSDFEFDELLQLATVRLIEIIGEASRNISAQVREAHPEIPWAAMAGARNRLIHGYFNVDLDIVWSILTNDLPVLHQNLEALVSELAGSPSRDLNT